ncbi:par-3 family cell polarity regulator isoform X1 [Musca autumnalis]|uniref:par-3 family cell polarity regulator isoform X1 n=1 Tax=Musca autumnalis TaxID=221902 RepID=UPI003CF8D3EC
MFDLPPKCPALANKLTGIFGWRHTYKVSAKHEGIQHSYLQKSYSLTLPTKRPPSPYGYVKDPDAWVSVHHLQTQCGILDPDDCVRDVADDREYIHASFEDSGPDPGVPQGGGDGASGSSSVGTGSPDIFRDPTNTDAPTNGGHIDNSTPHIEVTSTTACPITGLGLQVRRSSDPNLLASLKAGENGNKRWSAAAPHCGGDSPDRVLMEKANYLPPQWEEEDDGPHHVQVAPSHQPFARSGRLSMQFLGDGTGYKWMEAAEKLQQQNQYPPQHSATNGQHAQQQQQQQSNFFSSKSLPRESTRKEPLGQAYESIREKDGEMLLLINEYGSPLGLTAIPDNEHGGGLLVQHVEPGSRAERGRLRKGDRILEINGTKLIGLTELKVQEYLRKALEASELRVRVIRGNATKDSKYRRRDSKVAEMIEAEEKMSSGLETKVATVSPTRKPHTAPVGASLQVANTRKLGRKIEIILKKGPNGLGFSVTTRDNPAGGHCPIYIKNILPKGAAIEDGRLKPGDRLLEVDGILMTGKTQTDVVSILRATQPGATVRLVVSRQTELAEPEEREINFENKENEFDSPPKPPAPVLPQTPQHYEVKKSHSARSLFEQHQQHQNHNLNESQHFIDAGSESAASSDSLQAGVSWRSREMLTLHIPVHDTEKAGLGVSVKGKTTSNLTGSSNGSASGSMKNDGDLGIFVKSVIHGGAASRDGRLRMNDQLISVNGVTLLGQSNAEAMDTLKRAIVNNPGKHPGMITLQVARKITRSSSSGDILEHTNESSNTSENSGATVIYLSPEKRSEHQRNSGAGSSSASNEMNRWSNPVLDRLTGGACSGSSTQKGRSNAVTGTATVMSTGGSGSHTSGVKSAGNSGAHALRNESYYMATNDTWSPANFNQKHINNSVLIEHDPEPTSPTLPHRPNESIASSITNNSSNGGGGTQSGVAGPQNFDATYSSQLSLETNSGVEHFSRDALGRRSISEKHHAALDARETGTYQRNKKLREERERRVAQTKSAIYGSMESLTARINEANSKIPGYKHAKTNSGIEQQQLQAESRDQVGDLGPSLGLKKSSSLESLQTMVQEIQMSDEPRGGPTTLRAPRGRGREESLRAAVSSDHDVKKAKQTWLLEDGDPSDGGFNQRNGPCQSSLNDGKKSRAKKPGILRGIGYMFRFGKNRKDGVTPVESQPPITNNAANERTPANNQIPVAALAALDRNPKLPPPAYQPPPPLPPANANGPGGGHNNSNNNAAAEAMAAAIAAGIHQNDIFNHRYQHYSNYEELHNHHQQISDDNCSNSDVLSESTLECMRQQVLWQRLKVEAESRRHQHYHSQRSARSQDINMQNYPSQHNNNHNNNLNSSSNSKNSSIRSTNPTYYDYETAQHNLSQTSSSATASAAGPNNPSLNGSFQHRAGSIKQHNGHITVNAGQQSPSSAAAAQAQAHWKSAAMNGFSPANLNSSARSRGPFVTHVTLGPSNNNNIAAGQQQQQQPTYQTVQKHHHNMQQQQQHQQQQSQYSGAIAGPQHTTATASKV